MVEVSTAPNVSGTYYSWADVDCRTMRWIPAALVTAFALLSTSAAACSLAGPVPGPGQFFLFDLTSGKEIEVPVAGRWLGAGCELSNPFAFDGATFAWSEGPETSTAQQTMRIRTGDGKIQTLTTSSANHHEIGLTATHVYYLAGDYSSGNLWKQRLDDHQETRVDAQIPWHARLNGAHAAWFTPDGKQLNVYDAEGQRWILRDQTLAQLGITGDDQGQLFAFDDEFAFLSSYLSMQKPTTTFRYWTYEFATQELTDLSALKDPQASAVADGQLYFVNFDVKHEGQRLYAMPVSGGTKKDLGLLPHELGSRLVITKDQIVLASYRHEGRHGHVANPEASGWSSSSNPGQEPWSIPAPSFGLFAVALISLIRLRR